MLNIQLKEISEKLDKVLAFIERWEGSGYEKDIFCSHSPAYVDLSGRWHCPQCGAGPKLPPP